MFAVVLQALSARTVAIASCNVLKLKPHRQSIHLFLQGELSVDPTPLKPGGTSDDPGEMVERLQPVEPVENEPVDVGLRDGATQVTSTLGAVSAVDINGVEVAGSVGTEEPSRATPTTGTPLAETVDLDKKAPVVSTDASKVDLTVGAAHAADTNAVEVAGLGVPDDPDGATPATEDFLLELKFCRTMTPNGISVRLMMHPRNLVSCIRFIYWSSFEVETYRF